MSSTPYSAWRLGSNKLLPVLPVQSCPPASRKQEGGVACTAGIKVGLQGARMAMLASQSFESFLSWRRCMPHSLAHQLGTRKQSQSGWLS